VVATAQPARGPDAPEDETADVSQPAWLRLLLPVWVVGAVAVRWLRWESAAVLFNDGPVFLALARAAEAGDWTALLGHPFHPLYSLAIACVHGLGTPFGLGWESAGALTSALAGGFSVLALYAFVRRAFGPREAIIASGMLAFHATAIEQSGDIQSEGLYLALFLASTAALWPALVERRPGAAFLAGLFSGLAYLTRPEGLSLVLVGGSLALGFLALRRWTLRATFLWATALTLGVLLCVLPYVGAVWWESGELWLTRKKSVAWIAGIDGPPRHFAGADTVEPEWQALPLPAGIESPGLRGEARHKSDEAPRIQPRAEATGEPEARSLAARVGGAVFDLLRTSQRTLRYEVLPFLLLGIVGTAGRPGLRAAFVGAVLALHALLLFGLVLNVGYVSLRHALPPLSLLLGYAAFGVPVLARGLGSLRGRPVSIGFSAALVLVLVAGVGLGKTLRPDGLDELAERRAAEWLKANAEEEGPIATRKRRVAYYAELPFVQLRDKPLQRFVHYLDTHGVRYVVVNAADVSDYEGLEPLIGNWLERIHEERAEGEVAWVLRYQPPHHSTDPEGS
jgi:hypothetical protein